MSDEPPKKKRRGRPPEGERAMTPAERQRRVRFKRKRSPRREFILMATAQVQALNWTMTRIEEAVSALDEGQQRDLLVGYCISVREGWQRVLTSLRKADRPDP